jgi:hypothetical protein
MSTFLVIRPPARPPASPGLLVTLSATRRYLGVREFAHPWENAEKSPTNAALGSIKTLNTAMNERASQLLGQKGKADEGSCEFNLVLINRMEPESSSAGLKPEPQFKNGKCSVSWHADSTLEDFSTIGVYSCNEGRDGEKEWLVALRARCNSEGPGFHDPAQRGSQETKRRRREDAALPVMATAMQHGSAYFMLHDFNHHNQHAVLVGDSTRYSCTHRVTVQAGNTLRCIVQQCERALAAAAGAGAGGGVTAGGGAAAASLAGGGVAAGLDAGSGGAGSGSASATLRDQMRTECEAQDELEFEWIRQFFFQVPCTMARWCTRA